ncbi:MAG: diguanylate cyclase [Actinobacteria bacterium]|nr:MAG: diguanylate cyclase [Actinomycetota bacterium]
MSAMSPQERRDRNPRSEALPRDRIRATAFVAALSSSSRALSTPRASPAASAHECHSRSCTYITPRTRRIEAPTSHMSAAATICVRTLACGVRTVTLSASLRGPVEHAGLAEVRRRDAGAGRHGVLWTTECDSTDGGCRPSRSTTQRSPGGNAAAASVRSRIRGGDVVRQASWGPLRFRVPAIVVALFLVLAAVLVRGMRHTAVESYTAVEREKVGNDVRRAAAALDAQEQGLRATVADRAAWDDTYAFMDGYPDWYVVSNLTTPALAALRLDLMAFVDEAGSVGHIAGGDGTLPRETVTAIEAVAARVIREGADGERSGAVLLGEGPALVAAAPVTSSDRSAPPRGVLVIAHVLGASDLASLEEVTMLDVKLKPPREGDSSGDVPDQVYVEAVDDRTVAGRETLLGVDGKPAVRILVTERRSEFINAMATLEYAGWAILGLVLLFGLGMYAVLDLMVLGRLTQLHRELSAIGAAPTAPKRVSVRGSDEISDVATAVNTTLERLEAAEEALRHAAHHDYLTDLDNRRGFEREAVRELAERARRGGHCALILLDMDDFKVVNDTHGHQAGDRVLVQFAEILRTSMRSYSTVARLGGDEFAVLLPHTDRDEAMVALGRLNEALCEAEWDVGDGSLPIRTSAGIAVSPDDGETLDELVGAADGMLYAWKAEK